MGQINLDAQQAKKEIKSVAEGFNEVKKSVDLLNPRVKGLSDVYAILEKQERKVSNVMILHSKQMANASKHTASLKTQLKNTKNQLKNYELALAYTTGKLDAYSKSTKRASRETGKMSKSFEDLTRLRYLMQNLFGSFGIAGGMALFAQTIKEVFSLAKTFDSLRFAMERITKTQEGYVNAQGFVNSLVKDFGVELIATTNRYNKFFAAARNSGLAVKDTEKIFRSMTKASAVLGLKTDELVGVYLALEQMLSKGKVTTEELRRQLGERLPGAMGIMAAAIGKTIPQLDAMMKRGEIISAEVLPKFADALETAYDIRHVETVDTLVSEQNRLTAAWQTFVSIITEGDSAITKFFKVAFRLTREYITILGIVFSDQDQYLKQLQQGIQESTLNRYEKEAKKIVDANSKTGMTFDELSKKIKETNDNLQNVGEGTASQKQLQDELNELSRLQVIYNKELREQEVLLAKSEVEDFSKAVRKQKEWVDLLIKSEQALIKANLDSGDSWDFLQNQLKEARVQLAKYQGALSAANKTIQESVPAPLQPDEPTTPKRPYQARIKQFQEDFEGLSIRIIEEQVAILEGRIKNEILGADEIFKINEELFDKKTKIAELNNVKELKLLQQRIEKEEESFNTIKTRLETEQSAFSKGTEMWQFYQDQIEDADEALRDMYAFFEIEADKIDQKLRNTKIKIDTDEAVSAFNLFKQEISELENQIKIDVKTNIPEEDKKRAEEILRTLEKQNITTKERRNLINELSNIYTKTNNNIMKLLKRELEIEVAKIQALITQKNLRGEPIPPSAIKSLKFLKAKLSDIEAQMDRFKDAGQEITATDWLGYASEALSAVGDIFDAVHQRRIEQIEYEIRMEEERYDRMIMAAEGNEEKEKTLRRNKERDIQRLEKKRLKEEQRQAKLRKAFAVAQAGIDLASALVRVWAVPGAPAAVTLTPIIAAIGAAQIAAILAQPIPKYGEGGEIKKDEIALINEAGKQEFVQRGDEILTTERMNSIVQLQKGDVVHPNKDALHKAILTSVSFEKPDFISNRPLKDLGDEIKKSIKLGFRKAKINNEIKVINKNNIYREQMSRWN